MSRLKLAKIKDLGKIDKVDMNELKKIWGEFKFKYDDVSYQFSKVFTDDGPDYEVKIDGEAKVLKEFDEAIKYLEKNIKENKKVEGNNMSRLKQANHVSPFMHEKVNTHITSEPSGIQTKVEQSSMSFVIAKELMAALPLVPANEVLYNLVQDIEMGHYDDISSIEDAMKDENWENWKERTKELLIAKGLLVKTSRLKKNSKNIISENMKWVMTGNAEDGSWQEVFDIKEEGIKALEEQTGFEDLKNKSDAELGHIVDNWGRSFSLELLPIGNCEKCRNKNKPTVNIKGKEVCDDCWNDYERGDWEVKNDKIVRTAKLNSLITELTAGTATNLELTGGDIQKSENTLTLAKELIAAIPLVPDNEMVYELDNYIQMGLYNDISTPEQAHQHWDIWVKKTKEILIDKGFLVKSSRLKIFVKGTDLGVIKI